MTKRLLSVVGISLFTLCAFIAVKPGKAEALGYSPPTILCWFAQNPNFTSFQQYVCPPTSPNPTTFTGGTSGMNAYAFEDTMGMNTHFIDSEYGNFPYTLSLLQALNIHHIRDGLSTLSSGYVQTSLTSLAANGIHSSLTVYNNETAASIATYLSYIPAGIVDTIENPNELDISGDSNWAADDINETKNVVYPYVQANLPGVNITGPSIGGFGSYAVLGDLSNYITWGNTHDYEGGFLPETTGWGGPGYCGLNYASILYNLCNARQDSNKPIAATEWGYEVAVGVANEVPENAQGTFIIRQILQHVINGIPRQYLYELFDTDGQTYGIVSTNTHEQRPAFYELAGFMQVLKDTTPKFSNCIVPAYTNTPGVSSYGICKSNGEYDLVLWQPADTYDTNAKVYETIPTITAGVAYSPGFGPTSITQWSYDYNGNWTNNASVSPAAVPVTDRPSVVVFNGAASPTPLPAVPTPVP